MIKRWCADIGLSGNYGCHSLRKTFGYIQRVIFGVSVEVLSHRYNHSSIRTTQLYLGIDEEHFWKVIDSFRLPHIWKKVGGEWKLRHSVAKDGVDD